MPDEKRTYSPCLVYVTCPTVEEATALAKTLVTECLAACGSVVPSVRSFYHWNGALQEDTECMVMLKSFSSMYPRLESRILELHSYQVPEILMVPVERGSETYLHWMEESLLTQSQT